MQRECERDYSEWRAPVTGQQHLIPTELDLAFDHGAGTREA